ncbi:hypothetical protein [Neomegalonema sp.]|uniref:hypothetical protein n=1 Tax=Neomegalonema sp. TaxID=2039713 RepID=UPI002615170F|nr:hypothetical protein [Neomegalonema sp.]MDD2869084.1 hypothetical protein [Neomegalonema sp.]
MDDRRTNGRLLLDPLLMFPTSVDEITARMAGGRLWGGRGLAGVFLRLAFSAFAWGCDHEGLRRLQAFWPR